LVSTSTTKEKFVLWFEATSQSIWLRSFISGLEVVDTISKPLRIYCDNLINTSRIIRAEVVVSMYIKYLAIRELVKANKVIVEYISTKLMIIDLLIKSLPLPFVASK
jgi:hypothetical protein